MRTKIVQREFVLLQLLQLLFCFRLIDLGLNLFDQRKDVTHAQDSLGHAIRVEGLEGVILFADAHKLYRLPGYLFDGKRRTTTGVAVHLGKYYSRNTYAPVELFRGTHRILTRHSICYKENLDRTRLGFNAFEFDHQLVIDVQTAGSVN